MIVPDQCLRFLGVTSDSSARTLLGLEEDLPLNVARIDTALHARLSMVFRHPDGSSIDAERVRALLRKVAQDLKQDVATTKPEIRRAAEQATVRKPRRQQPAVLTPFDRRVLGVLVGCGGWNGRSRALLISLAAEHGVTVDGLMHVVGSLSNQARQGNVKIGLQQILPSTETEPHVTQARAIGNVPSTSQVLADRFIPELRDDSIGATVKLSLFFAAIAFFALIVFVKVMLPDSDPMNTTATTKTDTDDGAAHVDSNVDVNTPRPATHFERGIATFDEPPTFAGNGRPVKATEAADACIALMPHLEGIYRHALVDDELSEAVVRNWSESIDTLATGWVIVEGSTRRTLEEKIDEILYAAGRNSTLIDQVLDPLKPAGDRLVEPLDLLRSAWKTGTLTKAANDKRLASNIRGKASAILNDIDLDIPSVDHTFAFETGARRWLDRCVPHLAARVEFDVEAFDKWELWLACHRRLTRDDRHPSASEAFQAVLFEAISTMAHSSVDLSRGGPTTKVIGRLLQTADLNESVVAKDRFLDLFRDTAITSDDLWVMTSIVKVYSDALWYKDQFVVPADSTSVGRRRLADNLDRKFWPALENTTEATKSAGRGIVVNAEYLQAWTQTASTVDGIGHNAEPMHMLATLLLASRLNEAANLLANHDDRTAESLIEWLRSRATPEGIINSLPDTARSRPADILPSGVDGHWAAEYEAARKSGPDKLALLNQIRQSGANDLGTLDADVLVRAAYRGTPADVRTLARTLVTEQFNRGSNVAMQMLDQFPRAPGGTKIRNLISNYTGVLLSGSSGNEWRDDARRALVAHAADRLGTSSQLMNNLAAQLSQSYDTRADLVMGSNNRIRTGVQGDAQQSAARLLSARQQQANALIAMVPVPAELPTLARRHATRRQLASGPMQAFVAEQISVMEHLAYITVAEQPALELEINALVALAAQQRRVLPNILQQAVLVERTMMAIWSLRLVPDRLDGQDGGSP